LRLLLLTLICLHDAAVVVVVVVYYSMQWRTLTNYDIALALPNH